MATAVQRIVLSSSRDIPFNKLALSQSNVRRVKAGVSIEDLAASIARRGLIQSLSVIPVVDAEGHETGMFEVPAGGRRFRALELLVKQKRLAKIAPVPCVVRKRDDEILAEEVSLVENIDRAPLHPLDQFRAFQDMRVKGKTEEDIAAALFVPVQVVKQRLRLAAVSPTTDRGAMALNDYARSNDPFTRVGRQQVAVDVSSVIRASPDSFRVAWVERHYENGQLAETTRWTAILTIVVQIPRNADRLRANPLGIYVNAINWSRELGQ